MDGAHLAARTDATAGRHHHRASLNENIHQSVLEHSLAIELGPGNDEQAHAWSNAAALQELRSRDEVLVHSRCAGANKGVIDLLALHCGDIDTAVDAAS